MTTSQEPMTEAAPASWLNGCAPASIRTSSPGRESSARRRRRSTPCSRAAAFRRARPARETPLRLVSAKLSGELVQTGDGSGGLIVNAALGSGGVSAVFGENDLGGISVRVLVGIPAVDLRDHLVAVHQHLVLGAAVTR